MSGGHSPWLSREQRDLAESVHAWAGARIEPLAAAIDRDQEFSPGLWSQLRDFGIFALPVPEAAGGAGGSVLDYVIVLEQIARSCAVASLYPGTTTQVAQAILAHGTDELRASLLPRLVAGEAPAAWAFTEPGTGSDPRQIATRARREGGGWVLHGEKTFISYAASACAALVFARTSDTDVTAFVVDTAQPGWQVGSKPQVMSMGGTGASTVHLDGVRVPDSHVLARVGDGFTVMLAGEAVGKVRVSAINVGIAQRALDEAADYARRRLHRGTAIGEKFPSVQALLAEMSAAVLAARALLYETARAVDEGADPSSRAAALRLVSGRAAREAASAALQVCGAYGLTKEMVVERLYREAKFYEVAQGSAELQRVIAGKDALRSAGSAAGVGA